MKNDYAILYKCGKRRGYFQGMSGIGPMLGGTIKTAVRFPNEMAAHNEMDRWPIMASACCHVVALKPLRRK